MLTLQRLPFWACIALLVYMPFHIFLSQSVSMVTGGLDAWKVGKDVFLLLASMFTICLVFAKGKGTAVFRWLVGFTAMYGLLHLLLWMLVPDVYSRSAMLGTIYNMRLPLFLVLGYGAILLLPKFAFSSILKIVLGVSTVVAGLGILQFFLPGDLLTHLGYGIDRGARAAFYIDDNKDLPLRIMSTLREPNALGAFLLLPSAALVYLGLQTVEMRRRLQIGGLFLVHAVAILLTFSRSAWLGLFLVAALVVWWQYKAVIGRLLRRFWLLAIGIVLLAGVATFAMRNTYFFEHYIIHSNPEEQVADLDSNDYHLLFIQRGLEGIRDEPLGHGPGTAGLASIQNPDGSFLTENYYVQIGYELGVLGLALFVALNVWAYRQIRRNAGRWAVVLLASFWGYVLTNMLLHTWANEAVAAQWWLLAGMAIALQASGRERLPNKG